MKDVYCINLKAKPNSKFFDLYLKISSFFDIKMTHYAIFDTNKEKRHSGRLGKKGMQWLNDIDYDTVEEVDVYDLTTSKLYNVLFERSNLIMCEHYQYGYRFIIIVDEKNKDTAYLENVMQFFIDEDVINAYCFKYERALLPENVFWGVYSIPKEKVIQRTENENHLIELFSKIKHHNPLLMPQIFSNMFIKLDSCIELEKICQQLGYKYKQLGQGLIISTSENMRVPVDNRANKLSQYLEEQNILSKEF